MRMALGRQVSGILFEVVPTDAVTWVGGGRGAMRFRVATSGALAQGAAWRGAVSPTNEISGAQAAGTRELRRFAVSVERSRSPRVRGRYRAGTPES